MLDFDFSSMLYRIPALLIAITIHEYAHAQTAEAMGDPTPRFMGRLTFNPLAHLDPIGALMLIVAGFGWAKPVGINPNNFRNRREGILKVSFAGPAANLFLCFLAALIVALMTKFGVMTKGVYSFLLWTQLYNVWFAFFNLIPIPPLDGSKVLDVLLPERWYHLVLRYERYLMLAVVLLAWSGAFGGPLTVAMELVLRELCRVAQFPFALVEYYFF